MTVILVFIVSVIIASFWWLLHQGIMTKPWLETGPLDVLNAKPLLPVSQVGLGIFLVVIGSLFALFGSAFVMRMDLEIWSSLTLPPIVWANTGLLILASVFLHLAARAAQWNDQHGTTRDATIAGLATAGFVIGQLLAWRELMLTGNGLATGPAASFFYMLSGLHGLHILGGVAALGAITMQTETALSPIKLNIRLCAAYWDFLLVVWIGLLFLFAGRANQLLDICRSILT